MNMVDSLHNVGGLLNKYDVRRNIELIRTLYPEVENIAFISGQHLRRHLVAGARA